MKKTKTVLSIILISVVLLACLGFLGYFGVKTLRRSHLRVSAREAFAAGDWKKAEKLLTEYVGKDPDSEEDFVRLAQVYRHFGNTEEEMHCWYKASTLNPLKPEYWDNYTGCAMNARDFTHLYTTLNRKTFLSAELAPKDKMLYLVSAVMTGRLKEAEKYYEEMHEADPEAFQQDDLGRYAEFLVKRGKSNGTERSAFIEQGTCSDDPFVRLESILFYLGALQSSGRDADFVDEQMETMLKEAAHLNRFAGTPYLANYYFSRARFSSVIETAEPYLADIASIPLSVTFADSCVYEAQPEKLKQLADRYHTLGSRHRILASYFDALYLFSQNPEKKEELAGAMQKVGGVVHTDLANLINLQIALNNDILEKICTTFETIMKNALFPSVQERARVAVHQYLWNTVNENPALTDDPRVAKLVQLLASSGDKDPFLMRITVSDLYRRNLLTRQIIQENLDAFPDDPYLLQTAAEFELFNDDPEKCLEYVERFYALENEERSVTFDLLHMLALELSGQIDEAAQEYAALVDKAQTNQGFLYRYFDFCSRYERRAELSKMADRLDASTVPELKALAPFFRAEELFLQDKTEEALSLLETAKTEQADFALYAADKFSSCGRVDQALSRFLALVGRHPEQRLILANIAELQMVAGKKAEALSYAKQAWETDQDDGIGQFIYAQMLAANGRYQDAERVLRIPNRAVELPEAVKVLWTDIMLHCVREDLANGQFRRALDLANHYLILFPEDSAFLELKAEAEQKLKKGSES